MTAGPNNPEPPWLPIARAHRGLRETPGRATTPTIARWLLSLRAWWTDDETPWCGTFAAVVMREAGYKLPKAWYRARAWLEWGFPLDEPELGCIVVFARSGGGHVGFVVGRDRLRGRLMVLGGNQNDAVTVAPFPTWRVIGYRWPFEAVPMLADLDPLPAVDSLAPDSATEA